MGKYAVAHFRLVENLTCIAPFIRRERLSEKSLYKSLYIAGIAEPFFIFQTIWLGLPQYTMKYLVLGNLDLWQGKEDTSSNKLCSFVNHFI